MITHIVRAPNVIVRKYVITSQKLEQVIRDSDGREPEIHFKDRRRRAKFYGNIDLTNYVIADPLVIVYTFFAFYCYCAITV